MAKYHTAGGSQYVLGSSIGSTDTSILLSSFTEPVSGTPYTMVLLDTDIAYGTIAPKTSQSEFISFTGITQNANGSALLTGVTRGLAKKYPYTASATFRLPHSGQSIFILSDAPQVFEKYVSIVNDQTVAGIKTFSSSPIVPTGGTGTQAANNQDIANAITGVSGTATDSTFGTVKLSVAAASVPNPIAAGTNDPRIPTQGENDALVGNNTDVAVGAGNKFVTQTGLQHNAEKYAADAGSTDAYAITLSPAPTSYTNGMVVYFKANTVNTGAATINVNSLGAKTIVKGVNTTLVDGDIAAGQFCTIIYDGTNFVLQNTVSTAVTPVFSTSGVGESPASSSTQTITHGLGKIPNIIRIKGLGAFVASPGAAVYSSSDGTYNSTGNRCVYIVGNTGSSHAALSSTTFAVYFDSGLSAGSAASGVIQNVTSTSFDIVWTLTGSNINDKVFLWEAQ